MTENSPKELAKKAGRVALGPLTQRLDLVRRDLGQAQQRQDELAASLEQARSAMDRLEAYLDRTREELTAQINQAGSDAAVARSLGSTLGPDSPDQAGQRLREELDHTMLHAEAMARQSRAAFEQDLADVRATTRLTQALLERVLAGGSTSPDTASTEEVPRAAPAPAADPGFAHPVPSFDLLYRAFEDHHRGDRADITRRFRDDYLDLLLSLPNEALPFADLGCGRGELVELLVESGAEAIGVDSNEGQVPTDDGARFVHDDLFRWLDRQDDASLRAITSMHVVEHLPLDLQVRMVFEARRVLAPGGMLILETPNALSLSTAATNFWVDPTHERPVHPLFLEFLAREAGFSDIELRPLHPLEVHFSGADEAPRLAADIESLILGAGDMALICRR
jgi:SAM-dependent methyltransferase/chaperonin cofactor prefoldin